MYMTMPEEIDNTYAGQSIEARWFVGVDLMDDGSGGSGGGSGSGGDDTAGLEDQEPEGESGGSGDSGETGQVIIHGDIDRCFKKELSRLKKK